MSVITHYDPTLDRRDPLFAPPVDDFALGAIDEDQQRNGNGAMLDRAGLTTPLGANELHTPTPVLDLAEETPVHPALDRRKPMAPYHPNGVALGELPPEEGSHLEFAHLDGDGRGMESHWGLWHQEGDNGVAIDGLPGHFAMGLHGPEGDREFGLDTAQAILQGRSMTGEGLLGPAFIDWSLFEAHADLGIGENGVDAALAANAAEVGVNFGEHSADSDSDDVRRLSVGLGLGADFGARFEDKDGDGESELALKASLGPVGIERSNENWEEQALLLASPGAYTAKKAYDFAKWLTD